MHQTKTTQKSMLTASGKARVRHFLRDDDLSHSEYLEVIALALEFQRDFYFKTPYAGPRAVAVLFDKNSTRTRASFSAGIAHLGGYPLVMDAGTSQISRGESVADTVHVIEQMVDAIVWRTFGQNIVIEAAENAGVPVVNALTDTFHPCQVLADLATLAYLNGQAPRELRAGGGAKDGVPGGTPNMEPNSAQGSAPSGAQISAETSVSAPNIKRQAESIVGKSLVYLGDGANNMAHSYLLGCATAGVNITICCPDEYAPSASIVADAKALAAQNGSNVRVTSQVDVSGADVVTTDAWLSMGMDKSESEQRATAFIKYQVNSALMQQAPAQAIFLHCLPAYRNSEVTPEVIDGEQSVVFEEAGFRLHAQKALLTWLDAHSEIRR